MYRIIRVPPENGEEMRKRAAAEKFLDTTRKIRKIRTEEGSFLEIPVTEAGGEKVGDFALVEQKDPEPQEKNKPLREYLKYSFSETKHKKGVTIVEIDNKGEVSVNHRELIPRRDMRLIRGPLSELISKEVYSKENVEDYIYAVLTDEEELIDPISKLRAVYPNIMGLHREEKGLRENVRTSASRGYKDKSKLQLFEEFGLYIGLGHVVKANNKGLNKFTIVSPEGMEICSYSKIHPFSYSSENKFYEGGTEIFYTQIKDFNVSPFICYDLRFPEIFQIASKEAQLLVVAANWPKSRRDNWITLLKARAIENQCYVAAVNAVGLINGFEYSGDSLIIDPIGRIIAEASGNEELVTGDIDISEVSRYRTHFPVKLDRKEDLYKTLAVKKQ
jgi:predicted amidohydrolase